MLEDFLKAIPIGFGLAFMIGPVFFMLIQTSIIKGARAAIVFDLGVIVADIAFILLAYYSSHQFLSKIKDDPKLFFLGGAILIIYGLGIIIQKKSKQIDENEEFEIPEKNNYFGLFLKGFFLNFINVGVLAFWLIMVIGIGPSLDMDESRIFNFFAMVIIAYFITDIIKIVLAKQLKNKLTPPTILKLKRGMGILLVFFGLVLISKGFIPKEKMEKLDNLIEQVK
ncbi:LysE family translocator [Urechidicola croceus]|uniref:Lysine transporter LysE n=1 Tax=Urechidicola croceus TaxID=1850246 RepID=A0A1D8P903_9FLAO|nr:LysE family transporter [Urechidicola croceus]AOW21060.1 lysine transporter LysE [Urechidicola croceus]